MQSNRKIEKYTSLLPIFEYYPAKQAPFMHKQLAEWQQSRPLAGLKIINHVPLVTNTLLKIACLIEAGALVTVTNPFFMSAHATVLAILEKAKIDYVADITALHGKDFDIYFDCCAELYEKLGPPRIGAVELTASGDQYYRQQPLSFPVLSIDRTYTKQLETVFGSAHSAHQAINKLTGTETRKKTWMIFGFGKIGRGLAYFCVNNQTPLFVVDISDQARKDAESFGIKTIDPNNHEALHNALSETEIVITATGLKNILHKFPKHWFTGKILANMGLFDEFGPQFSAAEVLNEKKAINFILEDPTPIEYIDPEFYAHNIAGLKLLNKELVSGVHDLPTLLDQAIISNWCQYHCLSEQQVTAWFVKL